MNVARKPIARGVVVETVSPTELLQVLNGACSLDQAQIMASGDRLKQMLDMFGIFDSLQDVAAQRELPLPIRQQAIIQFTRAAPNHWKSRKLLSDDQRIRIRSRSMVFLDEEDDSIANFNKLSVSKIARHDYPNNWPTLLNDLLNVIDSNLQKRYSSILEDLRNTLVLRRSLQLLNAILKEFANMKMLHGIKTMGNIAEQLRFVLYGYYSRMASTFTATTLTPQTIDSQRIFDDIQLSHLVYKCIIRMAVWIWNRMDKLSLEERQSYQSWLEDLFRNTAVQIKSLTELRKTIVMSLGQGLPNQSSRTIKALTKHIRSMGKFFRRMQQLSHQRFVLLPTCGDIILYLWSQVVEATSGPQELIGDSDEVAYPLVFLVQGMVLFKDNLAQWSEVRKSGVHNINSLSQDFVENAVRLLVTRFMPLNSTDLENWMADPEEWANLEGKEDDQWEFEIRPCSERVLVQLSNQFPRFVIPLLQTTFKQVAPQSPTDLASVVQKEALYCAIGRCAIRMKDSIPFDEWLEHTLVIEARNTNPNYPIIKRRIAWLIGKWVSESCTSPNNPQIWATLVHLLQDRGAGSDAVVRFTAATALRECIDTIDFSPNVFAPFLPTATSELVRLIGEAETLESKRRVDATLNIVIERSESHIIPFMAIIAEPLPHLWTTAGEDWLLKGSLLVTVTKLVEAVKSESTTLGGIVVPLITESLSPEATAHLDEDGLALWLSALRNTLTISTVNGAPALKDIFPRAITLLASNLDLLGKITSIIESYFLLDAPDILKSHATELFQAFLAALKSEAVTSNMKDMIISLSLLVQVSPPALWGEAMHTSGLFNHLLMNLVEGEGNSLFLTEHIYLFSRMVMADRQLFLQLMSAASATTSQKEAYLYNGLLDQWWGKFDNMSEARHRKLAAMGIASLVSTGRPEVLERLSGEIFNIWLDVFGEVKEALEQAEDSDAPLASPTSLKRYWELDEPLSAYYQGSEGTPEYERRKVIYECDPVRTTQLNAYVSAHLREAEGICGAGLFESFLKTTDPTVLKQIQDALLQT